jgi:hypothetical protein
MQEKTMDFVFREQFLHAKIFTYTYGDVSEKKGPHEEVVSFTNFLINFVTPTLTNLRLLSDACTGRNSGGIVLHF